MKAFLQGQWFGHPLHPALVHLPTALWLAALVFDSLTLLGVGGNAMVQASFYAILFGLLAALLAIPTGLADWWDIKREKPAWKIGVYHLILNIIVTIIFAVNLSLRVERLNEAAFVSLIPAGLSLIGALLLLISGYLGGRMVYGYGISVARLSKQKWRRIAEEGGANVPPEQRGSP
jgi:uncharacterized membrane protein